jgi:hypothetical protein
VYKGRAEQAWAPYDHSTGHRRQLLAKIALRPKAKWFGKWIPDSQIEAKVHEYIDNAQAGNPDAVVQMTLFRMDPWEGRACKRLPTAKQQKSYKTWTDRFARAIGDTPVALILQADGPFALCAPHGSKVPSRLIGYSARRFSALSHTSVYIDAGAADWPAEGRQGGVAATVRFLIPASIKNARGFALNSTHYSSTVSEIARGTAIVKALKARGIAGKHFVINTSSNGQPFVFGDARGSDPDNANVCHTKKEHHCVTLGIPPTADVTNPRWHLPAAARRNAGAYVDAYLWFGRPWLFMQADPFLMTRALALARTTPY